MRFTAREGDTLVLKRLRLALSLMALLIVTGDAGTALGQDASPDARSPVDGYFDNVRALFSGERAMKTVAFVAPRWRVVGNEGFDASIRRVAALLEDAGYVPEEKAGPTAALTYRVEHRPLRQFAWEPVDASLTIAGQDVPVMQWKTNRNMLAINSFATPEGGVEADLVYVGEGRPEDFDGVDVKGKVVFGEAPVGSLFTEAVARRGALGVLAYHVPPYNQPETHPHLTSFSSVPLDPERHGWGLLLSYDARVRLKEALKKGPVRVRVAVEAQFDDKADELTLVADVHGRERPDERFVFSAHVQEPGANDNASGVGVLGEIARVTAQMVRAGTFTPRRSMTFIWGDEIRSTHRYIAEDSVRADGIRWGMSLDMVGEDTEKTGGTFLIEKMPDPSAIWTRGADRHTEWGGEPLTEDDMMPHYFNDFVRNRCMEQGKAAGWVVETNPFEGGSDHVPFLEAGIPGVLLWHFTDVYYHTDGDLIDKVSPETMTNVGVCALVSALTLVSADGETARDVASEVEQAALERLETEWRLSRRAVAAGAEPDGERYIIETWTDWYVKAMQSVEDVEVGGASVETLTCIDAAVKRIRHAGADYARRLATRE